MLRNGADTREAFFEQPPNNTETPHRGRFRIPVHDLLLAWEEMHLCELLELDKDYQASFTKKQFKTDGKNLVCIKCQKKVLMEGDVVPRLTPELAHLHSGLSAIALKFEGCCHIFIKIEKDILNIDYNSGNML